MAEQNGRTKMGEEKAGGAARGKAQHTPGPWMVRGRLGFGHHIVSNRDSPSGQIAVAYGECNPDGEANAKLIAAAPDLAEALLDLLNHYGGHGEAHMSAGLRALNERARAALRAADIEASTASAPKEPPDPPEGPEAQRG